MMTVSVSSWWMLLCVAAALNVAAWSWSARALNKRRGELCEETFAARRMQLILSAVYVIGCGFRSVIPLYDVPRLCVVDSWLCNVAVGRSVATVAELCFVTQWAVWLRELSRSTGSRVGELSATLIVPIIAVAESCSWYSVLTTDNIGHVIEESLWGLSTVLVIVGLVGIRSRCAGRLRYFVDGCCLVAVTYVAYMITIDVPMYWARWVADEAAGRNYLTLVDGFVDAVGRGRVSHRWEDWRHEVAWMSLYFSVAVWLSISLIHTPSVRDR